MAQSSPDVLVTRYENDETPEKKETLTMREKCLAPSSGGINDSLSESDRYYTASSGSGDESEDNALNLNEEDYSDDDGGLCIRLDSDEDTQSLSELHIDLKTLQAVSSMLAHYNPIIQRDVCGNPKFVAPAPPPEEDYLAESGECTPENRFSINNSNRNSNCEQKKDLSTNAGSKSEDYEGVLQQLDDAIFSQDKTLLSDAMSELTNVMEKITRQNDDVSEHQQSRSGSTRD